MTEASGEETSGLAGRPDRAAGADHRPRVAYLSFSSAEFDARSMRMARSAVAAGWQATIYARLEPGLPDVEEHHGFRIVRVPADGRRAVPGFRGIARRRAAVALAEAALLRGQRGPRQEPAPARAPRRVARLLPERLRRWRRSVIWFPLRPLGWAGALDDVVDAADVWHGMWAGSLPAVVRQRSRLGGRAVYDSRDVFMESRDWARLEWPLRPLLAAVERVFAQRVDRVVTVNEPYADLLAERLHVPRPVVVMNCPEAWTPPTPPPDRIRAALGLPATTSIALYTGQLVSDRGIEQAMDAILMVPDAVLVLLGYGPMAARLAELVEAPPYLGRVKLLPAVPPDELLAWTASADVTVMAIQPTSLNHRFTTPQKLFESLAAGVPVVASDLPGMRAIVAATGAGVVCDPTSPAAIAAAIDGVVNAGPARLEALRNAARTAARDTYNWPAQARVLFDLYEDLSLPASARRPPSARSGMERPPGVPPAADGPKPDGDGPVEEQQQIEESRAS